MQNELDNNIIIDILIPVYNTAKFLDECLQSIVGQTFKNWRGIIVDDCSTDNGESAALCDKWTKIDSRFEVHHLDKNIGLTQVRNLGLGLYKAPFVTCIDSDDYVAPNHLESLYTILINSTADFSCCSFWSMYNNGRLRKKKVFNGKDEVIYNPRLLRLNLQDKKFPSYLWRFLFRREIFNDIRFPENRRNFEDFPIVPRLLAKSRAMICSGEPTYYYRARPNSIVHTKTFSSTKDYVMSLLDRIEFSDSENVLDDYTKKALHIWYNKSMVNQYYDLLKMDLTPEEQKFVEFLEGKMKFYGVKPVKCGIFFYNQWLSLFKRYYEIVFKIDDYKRKKRAPKLN